MNLMETGINVYGQTLSINCLAITVWDGLVTVWNFWLGTVRFALWITNGAGGL